MDSWPAQPARPILRRSAHCSGRCNHRRPTKRWPKSYRSPCANRAPAAAAPCASSRSSGGARNRCREHHPGSRPHDASPVVCQKTPPAARCRPGPHGVRLLFSVTTRLPDIAYFKIAIGAIKKDHCRPKHLAQLPPHPRRNRRPSRLHAFPLA